MPMFAYTARDMSGKQVTGTVEANAEREVAGILSEKSLFPVEVNHRQALQMDPEGDILYLL